MSSNNEQFITLGNRLKELRNKHNLKITGLAEALGISHSYVGFLEKGTRKAKEHILKKYADFFRVSLDELIELQSQTMDPSQLQQSIFEPAETIGELNALLMKLNKEIQDSLVEQFKEQVQQTLYNLLTPYDISDIKRNITQLKNAWYSESVSEEMDEPINHRGYISLPSGQLYFQLEWNNSVFHIQLLYEDRKQLSLFENWLGECSVSYATDETIQHIDEPQKVLNILWLGPNMAYQEQYQYLADRDLLSLELTYSDTKLKWHVHNYQKQNSLKGINENIS